MRFARSGRSGKPTIQSSNAQARQQARRALVGIAGAESRAAITARVTTDRPFVERLVAFWSNHLCISVGAKILVAPLAGSYEREAIRPHVLGRFEDMLLASAKHPAMLVYLDNFQSIGPSSRGASGRAAAAGSSTRAERKLRARTARAAHARRRRRLHAAGRAGAREDSHWLDRWWSGSSIDAARCRQRTADDAGSAGTGPWLRRPTPTAASDLRFRSSCTSRDRRRCLERDTPKPASKRVSASFARSCVIRRPRDSWRRSSSPISSATSRRHPRSIASPACFATPTAIFARCRPRWSICPRRGAKARASSARRRTGWWPCFARSTRRRSAKRRCRCFGSCGILSGRRRRQRALATRHRNGPIPTRC